MLPIAGQTAEPIGLKFLWTESSPSKNWGVRLNQEHRNPLQRSCQKFQKFQKFQRFHQFRKFHQFQIFADFCFLLNIKVAVDAKTQL